jgi:membrane associated rhomboid family serine protease
MLRVSKTLVFRRHFTQSAQISQLKADLQLTIHAIPVQISYARPILFGLATSTSIFFAAAFIHEKEKETFWQRLKKRSSGPKWSNIRDVITDDKLILADLWEEKKKMWLEKKQAVMEDLKKKLEQYQSVPIEVKRVFLSGVQVYLSMSEAQKTMAGLIGINLLVFGAWKVRGLQPFMTRYFTHNPASGRSITLFTSCFSHRDLLHLTFNMVGLWSFGPLIHDVLGREQFVAMYLSLGISANVMSHVISLALRHSRPIAPSLGASGSLYGLLTGTALLYPNSSVFIAFLPMIPIRIR